MVTPLPYCGTPYVHEFEGAAAEIADDPVRRVEPGNHAEGRELGLPPTGQEFDPVAAGGLRRGEEFRAVLRVARGGRGQHEDTADLHRLAEDAEARERAERAPDRLLVEPARAEHVAAQPAQDFLVVERRRRAVQTVIGHEPHGIRADVDDRHRFHAVLHAGISLSREA